MRVLRAILILSLSCSLVFLPSAYSAEVLALPASDLIAPDIHHDPITKVVAFGERTTIRATVTDNSGIKDVFFFYREINTNEFKPLRLTREPDSDVYSAKLPPIEERIEYYLQATDLAENTVLLGQRFLPLTIAIAPATVPQKIPPAVQEPIDDKISTKKGGVSKWVWIGLGVLAVGALASGGENSDKVPPTATGTATITGPAP
ncbi:MAG: hypothetical protein GXP08_04325 [Gammaproteobacteria bacterium]|nr:hypothetical protein [Gammaproteobacteria bacterium]